ncbi:pentatricopeptide repeat-containing protein At3g09040, mitochondrial-like [Papaver somniferum]|uniref:pentatricopeptide repeat-containing protein At3g09040, mitochondrial-like n=1 Tax=Papaver somniferum TaxID=3469 RepID=UPI000E6F49CA|nr:pentatricopeptide repeat-containing protein At3g09040, mitochondrial-like [Papaver somniferum]XP_026434108.1 pentatricopeptide repeat-containing protein At3g09040, mitochondrial-like [Papaver somniferum]XP_026434109.1 pentatricopeptide repeat-containing protein At3g09040, mitochondrial-like [Papaver somniferum]XP_026434110.1 pentatricopeptide repeat-containing protein At3g09040, mitochondrial-like [Papaver somniferum]XP_026434111.1 pentatricopeptide repeat-containing protein At3g09040, mitoc
MRATHVRTSNLLKLNSVFSLRRVCFTSDAVLAVEEVQQNFQLVPNQNYTYSNLLYTCVQECKRIQSLHVCDKMPHLKSQATKKCKVIHAKTLSLGYGLEGKLGNIIVDLYGKCGETDFAMEVFNRLDRRDTVAWNSIMSMHSRSEFPEEVVRMFRLMRNSNTVSDQYTFALVVSACTKLNNVGLGKVFHCDAIKTDIELNSFCGGSLIDMYAKCDCLPDARKLFDRVDKPDTVSWTTMIAGYVRVGLPREALELFKEMERVVEKPDEVAVITIITACVGLGRLNQAIDLFSQLPNPNVVAWNVMIKGHSKSGFEKKAVSFFRDMHLVGVKPTRSTLGSVLSAIASLTDLNLGKQVHSEAIKLGLDCNVYAGSSLINMYSKCHSMESARKVFDAMDVTNTVVWNAMLGGYAQNGQSLEVKEIFSNMRNSGLEPDEFTYTKVLSAFGQWESLEMGRQFHAFIIKMNLELNLFVGNALVDMYAKSGDLKDARRQFELIPERDIVSWNAIIVGYVHEKDEEEGFRMFKKMIFDGFLPDQFSVSSILSGSANRQALEQGKQVHCFSVKLGLDLNIYAGSSLVDMYAKCGAMEAANKVISEMPVKTVVSRNALIAGYIQNNNADEAVKEFLDMQAEGLQPSKYTFASILTACSASSRLNLGRQVHCDTLKSGVLVDDEFSGVSLLGMYLRSSSTEDANKLFLEFLKQRSRVLWTCMISGHAQNGNSSEALCFFREMRNDDVLPDQSTFTSVLSACSGLAALQDGKVIHCLAFHTRFDLDESTCSVLVDMYAKCGDIGSSMKVFEEMVNKEDAVSWNSMIVGFAKNGYAGKALKIFNQMKHTNVKPDDITFLGVLTACSHGGMVLEGREYFNLMICSGIKPRDDHFSCMIDLLGRHGRLKEAEELIEKLPFEPGAGVWATLLGACKIHGDLIRGQKAAEKLILLEPDNPTSYVLLSNLYAASKNWGASNRVRNLMKERGLKKFPGCSWIEVNAKLNLFVAGDKLHINAGEVRAVLKDLTALMREQGYIATTDFLLDEED